MSRTRNSLGGADHLDLIPVRVVDVKSSDALQHRMHAVPHLDAGFDEARFQLVVGAAVDAKRKVVQHPLLLSGIPPGLATIRNLLGIVGGDMISRPNWSR